MVNYLLDSNVVSELRKKTPHGAVLSWINSTEAGKIYLPAIVAGKLQAGAEITRRQDAAKAAELDRWSDEVIRTWQVVPVDADITREWARLIERKSKILFEDALIATTARILGFSVVTRNVRDFERFGVEIINPFLTNPDESGAAI